MGTMTDNETYNGYANRETWAFNLHWQNDQGLYGATLAIAQDYVSSTETTELDTDSRLGEVVVNYWREFIDEVDQPSDGLKMWDREVGSWWRIDYAEVGAAVRESLDNES